MPLRIGFLIEMKPSVVGPLTLSTPVDGGALLQNVAGHEAIEAEPILL